MDKERKVCVCNGVSVTDLVEVVKDENIQNMETLLAQDIVCVGNKCESCVDDGYEDDGFSLAMVLSLVKEGKI